MPGRAVHSDQMKSPTGAPVTSPLFVTSPDAGLNWWDADPIPSSAEYLHMSHDMVVNRKQGLLHVGWWEVKKMGALQMRLQLVTIGK